MKYLLDSNACIQSLRINGSPVVKARLASHAPTDLALPAVAVGELYYGAERSARPDAERAKVAAFVARFVSLPFDNAAAEVFARVRAGLAARGTPVGPLDTMIAAIALTHGLIVVTHNTRDFARVPGLAWEDWEIP